MSLWRVSEYRFLKSYIHNQTSRIRKRRRRKSTSADRIKRWKIPENIDLQSRTLVSQESRFIAWGGSGSLALKAFAWSLFVYTEERPRRENASFLTDTTGERSALPHLCISSSLFLATLDFPLYCSYSVLSETFIRLDGWTIKSFLFDGTLL
jgi:hypothetical protein